MSYNERMLKECGEVGGMRIGRETKAYGDNQPSVTLSTNVT
jgi:hypothetical protein